MFKNQATHDSPLLLPENFVPLGDLQPNNKPTSLPCKKFNVNVIGRLLRFWKKYDSISLAINLEGIQGHNAGYGNFVVHCYEKDFGKEKINGIATSVKLNDLIIFTNIDVKVSKTDHIKKM